MSLKILEKIKSIIPIIPATINVIEMTATVVILTTWELGYSTFFASVIDSCMNRVIFSIILVSRSGGTRTHNLRIWNPMLYLVELRTFIIKLGLTHFVKFFA
jgi:hypothetical protein